MISMSYLSVKRPYKGLIGLVMPKLLLWTLRIVSVALVVGVQLTSRHLRIPIIALAPDVVLLCRGFSYSRLLYSLLGCKVPELPAVAAASELLTIRADWRMAGDQRWKEHLGPEPPLYSFSFVFPKALAKSLKAI